MPIPNHRRSKVSNRSTSWTCRSGTGRPQATPSIRFVCAPTTLITIQDEPVHALDKLAKYLRGDRRLLDASTTVLTYDIAAGLHKCLMPAYLTIHRCVAAVLRRRQITQDTVVGAVGSGLRPECAARPLAAPPGHTSPPAWPLPTRAAYDPALSGHQAARVFSQIAQCRQAPRSQSDLLGVRVPRASLSHIGPEGARRDQWG